MSDDLISRRTLLDELDSLRIELNGISCRKEFKKTVKEILDYVKHLIEDQPTAFDKKLPERKTPSKLTPSPMIDHYYTDYDKGWNDCLDTILSDKTGDGKK